MMKIKKILLASALVLSTCGVMAQTQVIAHRGYWKTDGSAQNSIAALLKADSIGCYGKKHGTLYGSKPYFTEAG